MKAIVYTAYGPPEVLRLQEVAKIRAIIDRRFPLAEMAAAHRYVEAAGNRGPVVIVI